MRVGIGGKLGPVRGGVSNRGLGVGVGPFSAGTSFKTKSRKKAPSSSGGFFHSVFWGGLMLAAIWLVVVAWPVLLVLAVAVICYFVGRGISRSRQRRRELEHETERLTAAADAEARAQQEAALGRERFAVQQTQQLAFAVRACDCDTRPLDAAAGPGMSGHEQKVGPTPIRPEDPEVLNMEDWYTHSVRHFGNDLHAVIDGDHQDWLSVTILTNDDGYEASVTGLDMSKTKVRLPDAQRLHLHSLTVRDTSGDGPVRAMIFQVYCGGSRGGIVAAAPLTSGDA